MNPAEVAKRIAARKSTEAPAPVFILRDGCTAARVEGKLVFTLVTDKYPQFQVGDAVPLAWDYQILTYPKDGS